MTWRRQRGCESSSSCIRRSYRGTSSALSGSATNRWPMPRTLPLRSRAVAEEGGDEDEAARARVGPAVGEGQQRLVACGDVARQVDVEDAVDPAAEGLRGRRVDAAREPFELLGLLAQLAVDAGVELVDEHLARHQHGACRHEGAGAVAGAGCWEGGSVLTLDDALRLLDAARTAATETGVPMAFAVMDPGGHLLALARMDGAPWITSDVAQGKAWTAAAYGVPSAAQKDKMQPMPNFADVDHGHDARALHAADRRRARLPRRRARRRARRQRRHRRPGRGRLRRPPCGDRASAPPPEAPLLRRPVDTPLGGPADAARADAGRCAHGHPQRVVLDHRPARGAVRPRVRRSPDHRGRHRRRRRDRARRDRVAPRPDRRGRHLRRERPGALRAADRGAARHRGRGHPQGQRPDLPAPPRRQDRGALEGARCAPATTCRWPTRRAWRGCAWPSPSSPTTSGA